MGDELAYCDYCEKIHAKSASHLDELPTMSEFDRLKAQKDAILKRQEMQRAPTNMPKPKSNLAELEADKRRLDWLEAHPEEITYGGTFGLQYKWVQWPDEVGRADATLRVAIDFAMAEEAK